MANVLCVVAHPDDEVLGCGGTLAKHAENGDEVGIWYGTDHYHDERNDAAAILGLSTSVVGCLALPDQKFETVPIIESQQFMEMSTFQPDVIYTHHPGDLNLDHALIARAVLTAFRPKPESKPRTILACEVLSSTEYTYPRVFQPNWYVSLTADQVSQAQDALACYASEVHSYPHPRSRTAIRNRAAVRGSEIGVDYAEAFQLLRGGPF